MTVCGNDLAVKNSDKLGGGGVTMATTRVEQGVTWENLSRYCDGGGDVEVTKGFECVPGVWKTGK